MQLRTQILSLGLAGAIVAGAVGAISLVSAAALTTSIGNLVESGQALQLSQQADMMHDAIRADAQQALLGALEKNPATIDEADKDLREHADVLTGALNELRGLPLSAETQSSLSLAQPLAGQYVTAARNTIQAARRDAAAGQAQMPELQKAFGELETRMAELSESIGANSERMKSDASAGVTRTRLQIGIALALAAVGLVAAALVLARRMTGPMDRAVDLAERLAEGDLRTRVVPAGNARVATRAASSVRAGAMRSPPRCRPPRH